MDTGKASLRDFAGAESSGGAQRINAGKLLTEMSGELRNTLPRQEVMLQIKDRECIAMKHLIKCGGQRRSMACCEHAGTNLQNLKARTQDIVDNEVVQTKNQRKFERLTKNPPKSLSKALAKLKQ